MTKSLKIYILILVLILALIVAMDISKPKPINWEPSYGVNDKIPFGLYVLDHELEKMTGQKVMRFKESPYEYFESRYDYDSLVNNYKVKGTFLYISDTKIIDSESAQEILYFVSHKNAAFISMKEFPKVILDSLKVETNFELKLSDSIQKLWLSNQKLGTKKYSLKEEVGPDYFGKFDTLTTKVLGYQNGDAKRVNFIKVNYNGGEIYLHTQPAAFTNYHLLKDNHKEYAEKVLSYLPKNDIHWLSGRSNSVMTDSELNFIFKNPALKSAWLLFMIGMLFFMIFNAKRKQRIVPIIKPLPNTTVDFTKTIGNLYYQEGDHTTIIDKKIIYFLERVRNEFLMDTSKLDADFIKRLHQKSGKDYYIIEKAIYLINNHKKSPHNSIEEDLVEINKAIENVFE